MAESKMNDLATQVASMGQWVGQVWEYALRVREQCTLKTSSHTAYYTNERVPYRIGDCPLCHGLGWTASTRLENWLEEGRDYGLELVRGSNAYDHQLEHKRWVGRAISVHKFRRIEVGSDNVQGAVLGALRQALQSEGYTVHPDVEKVKETL